MDLKYCFLNVFIFLVHYICLTKTDDPIFHRNWRFVNSEDCGIRFVNRINGGSKAAVGQFPWLVLVGYTKFGKTFFKCGGAIIHSLFVLTAAHCCVNSKDNIYKYSNQSTLVETYFSVQHGGYEHLSLNASAQEKTIRAGDNFISTDPDCDRHICAPPAIEVNVNNVSYHHDYNKYGQLENDICILHLERPLEFSDFVLPICIPYGKLATRDLTGQIMEVAGWGSVNPDTKNMSGQLNYVKMPVMSHALCKKTLERFILINKDQLCVGGQTGKDTCEGDSGGPLMKTVQYDGVPRYFIFGIVSYGLKFCGKSGYPGVYTNITAYSTWILDHIQPQ